MTQLHIIALLVGFLGGVSLSTIALAAEGTGNVGGTMTAPISLAETRELDFGNVSIPSSGTSTVSVRPVTQNSSNVTLNANGTDSVLLSTAGAIHALFSSTKEPDVTIQASASIGTAPTGVALTFIGSDGLGNLLTTPVQYTNSFTNVQWRIGADVAISDTATPGSVTSGQLTYTFSIVYQ